jgi:hypothetical protein
LRPDLLVEGPGGNPTRSKRFIVGTLVGELRPQQGKLAVDARRMRHLNGGRAVKVFGNGQIARGDLCVAAKVRFIDAFPVCDGYQMTAT